MEEQDLLASFDANLQEQDVYEDHVIRQATLQLAPTLTGVGFPCLAELVATSSPGTATTAPIWKILSQTQREINNAAATAINNDDDDHAATRDRLLLKEQVLMHYLTSCGGFAEQDLPKRSVQPPIAAVATTATTTTTRAETKPPPPPATTTVSTIRTVLHKRVPMMKRKRVSNSTKEDNDDDEEEEEVKYKEELKRLRKERLQRRAQRRQEWSSSSSSSSDSDSDKEQVLGETTEDANTLETMEQEGPNNSEQQSALESTTAAQQPETTAICPLCQEPVSAEDKEAIDQTLALHMDQCQRQRRGRPSRQSTRTSMQTPPLDVPATARASRSRKRARKNPVTRAPRLTVQVDVIDDFEEMAYEDRVDDWIEHGLERMRDMKERDASEELPGAENYQGLWIPAWMNDRLFSYQRVALRWMWDLHLQEAGGILGDEMGLGKTVQVCAYMGALAASRKLKSVLIVAPATMLRHWLTELSVWAPGLRRILIHQSGESDGMSRSISTLMLNQLARWLKRSRADRLYEAIDAQDWETMESHSFCGTGYAVVTTYENLRRNADVYTMHPWSYVVLDEAQKIRNPDADVTLACKRIQTAHRIAMSGTPIQNDLRELWSLLDWVFPGRLGTLPAFEQEFADPIRRGGYSNATPMQVQLAYRCALMLRDLIEPYLLRRRKKDVKEVSRMPAKTEHVLFCRLSRRQRLMYEAYLVSDDVQRVVRGTGQLLAAVTMLRKICNHPDLVIDPDQASLDSFLKSGCTSQADDSDDLSDNGSIEAEETLMERSGKLEVLAKILPLWHQQGHRVLIFCQWRKMLNIIQRLMMIKNWKFARLDGSTNVASRQRLVDSFNTDDSYFCMLCTTRTGGVGLNLTGANRIILYDPDFNPQTDAQARERAWRFGQEREVTVYRFICAGTVEEKIYQRQIFKTALTNSVLQDPRQRRLFSQRDLKDLFTLKADTGSIRGGGHGLTETGEATRGVGVVAPDDGTPVDTSKDDEATLRKVMKSKGLAGIFDHSFIEQESMRKSITQREMEEQAKEVARKAVSALRQSVVDHDRFEPTWTGSHETESRFGSSKVTVGSGKGQASSSGLLASLRQRQAAVESGGLNVPPSEESKQYAKLLSQIREFVGRRRPSTDDLLAQFEGSPNFDLTTFRQLLKSVASVENGRWRLK